MSGAIAIDIGFVTGLVTYSRGLVGGPAFYLCEASVLVWLLAANVLALGTRTLPRPLAWLGIATALTATLPYVVCATWLARTSVAEEA